MNWIDIVILAVWGITALWGFMTGFFRVILPLLVVIVAVAISSRVGDSVGNVFSLFTDNENAQSVAGFVLVLVVLFIIGSVASFWVNKLLRFIPLFGLANKMAGMAVGLLAGFILLSGVLTGIQKYPVRDLDKKIDDSALGAFLADNFDVVTRGINLIPGDWDDEFTNLAN